MLEMLLTIAPMFLILAVGFMAGFAQRFRAAQPGLNAFVFYFGLPTFLYSEVSTAPSMPGVPMGAILIAAAVTLGLSVAVYHISRLMGPQARAEAAPTSLAGTFGNVGYFGIPISISTVGPEAALAAGLVHLVHNIIYMTGYPLVRTAAQIRGADQPLRPGQHDGIGQHGGPAQDGGAAQDDQSAQRGGGGRSFGSAWRRRLWPLVRRAVLFNPVAIAMVLAIPTAATDLELPGVLDDSVHMVGATAVPLALFAVGLAMHPAIEGIHSGGVPKRSIVLGTTAKILALPLLTWAAVIPFYDHLGPVWAMVLVIMAAMPSSTTVFIFSEEYDGDGRLAAAILVFGTLGSIVTIPLVAELLL